MNAETFSNVQTTASCLTTSQEGDSAGGVQTPMHWYVAVVKNNTELKMRQLFEGRGVECYVASQLDSTRGKDGKKKPYEHVLIPARVMLRCTETERKVLVKTPGILHFLTNMAQRPDRFGHHPFAIIPDAQMERLQSFLSNASDLVEVSLLPPSEGDRVRVVSGPLIGVEGIVQKISPSKCTLYADFGVLGYLSAQVDMSLVEKVE